MCCLCLNNSSVKTTAAVISETVNHHNSGTHGCRFKCDPRPVAVQRSFFADKGDLLLPFGLDCSAGILSKCLQKASVSKARFGVTRCASNSFPQRFSQLFCEIVSRWSCDLWKVFHCLLMGCMLNNHIYTPVFRCPRNLAAKEFG